MEDRHKDSPKLSYSFPAQADQQLKGGEGNISAAHVTSDLQELVEPRYSNPSLLGPGNSKEVSFQTQIKEVNPSTLQRGLAPEASTTFLVDHALPSLSNSSKPTWYREAQSIEASSHYQLGSEIEVGKAQNPSPSPNQYEVPQNPFKISRQPNRDVTLQRITHHVEPSDSSLLINEQQGPSNLLLEHHPTKLHHTNVLPSPFPTEVEDIPRSTSPRNARESWLFASKSLMAGPKGRRLAQLEDILGEDIPIRAILHGWDALGEPWELSPFWQNIRQLDENLLYAINEVERLAIFRIMHLLMRFHSDPSPRRAAKLPSFYSKTIEFAPDYYIGHYLPWPGVRALAKNPLHPFRSNAWFRTEIQTLKVLWPGGLHDCYTRSLETGLFKMSPSFDARLFDINSWTFGPEMFETFPMTYGVARAFNSIPQLVGGGVNAGYKHNTKGVEGDLVRLMEDVPVDYGKLKWGYEMWQGRTVLYFTIW